jgi:uncharacterized protein (TIGR03089 family)
MADLLASRTRREGHRPLLTCYDDLTGARTELSYATLDNWAAKTANLLVEEYDVRAGGTVALDLDGHWATAALALACWKLGAAVTAHDGAGADVVCCHETRADRHRTGAVVVVGDGFAAEPLTPVDERDGLLLLGEHVHGFADDYDGIDVGGHTPALASAVGPVSHAALVACAGAWHDVLGDGPRVGLAAPLDHPRAFDLLAGVIAAGGSLVAVRAHAAPSYAARWTSERATVVAGPADAVTAVGDVAVVTFDAVDPPG